MATEKVLTYSRDQVTQDTFYNCGPASAQTVIRAATGRVIPESTLASAMGTTVNGTNDIANIQPVLNTYVPEGKWERQYIKGDDASNKERETLWQRVRISIDAGYGCIANIIAPPSNYPRPTYTSSVQPRYSGGTVYHYIALMGYALDGSGNRHIWVADSGFYPYGYWCSLEQMASLIAGKGYIYSTAPTVYTEPSEEEAMSQMSEQIGRIYHELTHTFQTRYKIGDKLAEYRDTMIGYVLNNDEKLTRLMDDRLPNIEKKLDDILKALKEK
ncbi:hypothetical protein GP475_09660 [Corynebacterium poyangense]|uniref:Peptidase C39-like domain-containing protein n=1 Tax=Corynebacterium poyangense TaxID=2684405 RepID=A0A7H0SQQ0_9CORY|nr:C39 family peptidase [Corynebacterium poyangense]QNQ90875.1 hypothetical protein GP475_09660 [Corynebacterium poyangense]